MKKKLNIEKITIIYYFFLLCVTSVITGRQLKMIRQFQTTEVVKHSKLDYDAFRRMDLLPEVVKEAVESDNKDYAGYLAYEMLARDYRLDETRDLPDKNIFAQMKKVEDLEVYEELHYYYSMLFQDLEYFPVPLQKDGMETVYYDNSWGAARTYGGERVHEGCDLMASKDQRGFYPILSVSDGVVENIGWLPLGGYRIGIRAPHGAYFYYAHLYSYAPEIKKDDEVKAGQLLGFMGDSGYGEEGTTGQFPVHLHFGVYINSKEGEMSVNPYPMLKYLEEHKLTCEY